MSAFDDFVERGAFWEQEKIVLRGVWEAVSLGNGFNQSWPAIRELFSLWVNEPEPKPSLPKAYDTEITYDALHFLSQSKALDAATPIGLIKALYLPLSSLERPSGPLDNESSFCSANVLEHLEVIGRIYLMIHAETLMQKVHPAEKDVMRHLYIYSTSAFKIMPLQKIRELLADKSKHDPEVTPAFRQINKREGLILHHIFNDEDLSKFENIESFITSLSLNNTSNNYLEYLEYVSNYSDNYQEHLNYISKYSPSEDGPSNIAVSNHLNSLRYLLYILTFIGSSHGDESIYVRSSGERLIHFLPEERPVLYILSQVFAWERSIFLFRMRDFLKKGEVPDFATPKEEIGEALSFLIRNTIYDKHGNMKTWGEFIGGLSIFNIMYNPSLHVKSNEQWLFYVDGGRTITPGVAVNTHIELLSILRQTILFEIGKYERSYAKALKILSYDGPADLTLYTSQKAVDGLPSKHHAGLLSLFKSANADECELADDELMSLVRKADFSQVKDWPECLEALNKALSAPIMKKGVNEEDSIISNMNDHIAERHRKLVFAIAGWIETHPLS